MLGFRVWMIRFLLVASCLATPVALLAADPVYTPPSLKIARRNPSVFVRSDGKIYVAGGTDAQRYLISDTEIYDLTSGSVFLPSQPPLASSDIRGASDGTVVFLSRNRVMFCALRDCEVYDPTLSIWPTFKLPGNLVSAYAVLADGNVLRAGGYRGPVTSNAETYVINSETFAAQQVGSMQYSAQENNLVLLKDGRIFAPGGIYTVQGPFPYIPQHIKDAQIYDPKTQTWIKTSSMIFHGGTVSGVLLPDGRVLVGGGDQISEPNQYAEIYDPVGDSWTVADGVRWSSFGKAILLPNGSVLISDGSKTIIWNPATGEVRQGRSPTIPRYAQGLVVLPNGTVLAMGGTTLDSARGEPTSSVEVLAFPSPDPPVTTLTLSPNFYIATANQSGPKDDGLCGIQATYPGYTDGGMFFGGLLAAQGSEVAFASFSITESQTVTVRADLLPFPNSKGALDVTLRMLDSNRNPIAPAVSATGSVNWTGQLTPGFYVVELRSGTNAPASVVNGSVNVTRLQGGVSAGGSLVWSAGVTGWLAFSVADKQDVTFQLSNEQSYGIGRGAGSVVLTVLDGAGNILRKLASGGVTR